jgi:hypothetical protein
VSKGDEQQHEHDSKSNERRRSVRDDALTHVLQRGARCCW